MHNNVDIPPVALRELILYACPTGDMAAHLDHYFAASRAACGVNAAHRYMPHITLTGFFHDESETIPFYVERVEASVTAALAAEPDPEIRLTRIGFEDGFHRIEVESPWLKQLTVDFIARAHRPDRREAIRKKDWLHLSLAYEFPTAHATTLQALAERSVHLDAAVGWEIRFYERHPENAWTCHSYWPL